MPAFLRTDKSLLYESFVIAGDGDQTSISMYYSTAEAKLSRQVVSKDGFRAFATTNESSFLM